PGVAALALGVWFMFELQYDMKYHTVFLGISCVAVAVSGAPAGIWSIVSGDASGVYVGSFVHSMLVMLVAQVYWSSAWRKIQAPRFLSGKSLAALLRHYAHVR